MKIYTNTLNANQTSLVQVNVPNYSDFKLGIEVEKDGQKVDLGKDDVTLVTGDTTISADGAYNGYVTFPLSTGDCGDDKTFTVKCDKGYDIDISKYYGPESEARWTDALSANLPKGCEIDPTVAGGGGARYVYYDNTPMYQSVKNPASGKTEWYNLTSTTFTPTITIDDNNYIIYVKQKYLQPGNSTTIYIKVGTPFSANFNLVVNSAKSSVCEAVPAFELPIASSTTLGGVKVGDNLTIDADGKLNAAGGGMKYIRCDSSTLDYSVYPFNAGDIVYNDFGGLNEIVKDGKTYVANDGNSVILGIFFRV